MGWSAENTEKRRKQTEEKHWIVKRKKSEEYQESQIPTIYIFGFKLYFAQKYNLKKRLFIPSNFIYSFYALQDIWNTNNTLNLNVHKCTNYNIIEIHTNRLITTT